MSDAKFEFNLGDVLVCIGRPGKCVVWCRKMDTYYVVPMENIVDGLGSMDFLAAPADHANYVKVGKWDFKKRCEVDDD